MELKLLGQSGVRLALGSTVVYIDPYLTEYVYEVEKHEDLKRLIPPPMAPDEVDDADWVLVTHGHLDHCDPTTVGPITVSSPKAQVVAPTVCRPILEEAGVDLGRVVASPEKGEELAGDVRVYAVPASHPEIVRDDDGNLECVGYVIEHHGVRIYHAGDTSPADELVEAVRRVGPIDVALLPVNERSFQRDKRGIIGNMTVREAFWVAEQIEARRMVPIHWDMFAPNRVYPEEIELLHKKIAPPFELHFSTDGLF